MCHNINITIEALLIDRKIEGGGRAMSNYSTVTYGEDRSLHPTTLQQALDMRYQQGRVDLANELLAIKDPCDVCDGYFCESCEKRTAWSFAVKEKLEQIKEQNNE